MKRCSPLLARAQRLPQRLPLGCTTTSGWRRALCVSSSDSQHRNQSDLSVRPRQPQPLPPMLAASRGFASSSRSPTSTNAASTINTAKTAVSADDFDALKQFLMKPSTGDAAATAAKRVVERMLAHHVYADMAGQEAAVMSMVADALEDYPFVIYVYAALRRARVAPSPMTLELTAAACAQTGDVASARDVVEQMHRAVELMHPSIDIYENAVRACHTAGAWMQAKQLLDAVATDRLEASVETHVLVMETCVVANELTATTKLLDSFLREFAVLEREEVRAVLDGLLATALERAVLDHALYFRDQLAQRHMEIPRDTYEQMVALCARQGKWHRARVLVAQLTKARALPAAAPSFAFTDDTDKLLSEMHTHGLKISLDVYNAALRAYGGQTKLAKAEALLATMRQRGVKPDTVSLAAVVCSCGSDVAASQRYFGELQQSGLPLSMDAIHVYLLAPSRAKEWRVVVDRYHTIRALATEQQRDEMSHDRRIMSCVATAHGSLENDDEMLRVFTGMKVHGLVPNLYVYAEAMKAYVRKGQWRHALMLFDHMWTEDIDKDKLAQFPLHWDTAVEAAIVGEDTERLETLYQQVAKQHGRLRPHAAATLIDAMTSIPTEKIWNDFLPIKYIHERRNVGDESQRSWFVVNAVLKRAVSEWDAPLAEKIVRDAETKLAMRQFNAMTYSLMLELYARKKDHESFLRWGEKMAHAGSKVTAYTTRALLLHLRSLSEFDDDVAVDEVASVAESLFGVDHALRAAVRFTPYETAAELGRQILDIWEVRGNPIHMPTVEEYIGLCQSAADLEDVFQRLDRQSENEEPLEFSPEFIQSLFLTITEAAPELLPRLRDFLVDCIETQAKESATAALGVFCSVSEPEEAMEMFKTLVAESEDGQLEDEELVIFLASCATDPENGSDTTTVDINQLREICLVIVENEMALGAGSITFLIRSLLLLSRSQSTSSSSSFVQETLDLARSLVAAALEGSSREELRSFVGRLSTDPRDAAAIDEVVEALL